MASYPPPPPPPPPPGYGAGYVPGSGYDRRAWKAQRRAAKVQARWMRDQYRMQRRLVRRRSVVGPLVLVTLGVVLLLEQTGRLSWAYSLAWYARWWPVVLIVAGVILLVEWIFDQQRMEETGLPHTAHALSAGAVFLLIVLAGIGLSARWVDTGPGPWHGAWFGQNLAGLERVFGEAHESDDSLSQALPQGQILVVHNPWGAVTVTGSSEDGQVHVSVHKQVYAWRDTEAEDRARRLQPTFSTQGSNLMLDVPAIDRGQADLTIEMPHGAAISLSADHGDVRVSELHGDVTVSARKGDVDLSGINGTVLAQVNNDDSSVTAKGVKGSFTVEGRAGDISLENIDGPVMLQGDFFGTTEAQQVNGPLRFETSRTNFSAARVDGDLSIESGDLQGNRLLGPVMLTSRNRTIELDDISGAVTVTNRNGAVSVTSATPLGTVEISNQHGSIDLGLPEHAAFSLDAQAKNGSLENDFGLEPQGDNAVRRLSGTVGSGGPTVRVMTSDGDVTIRKAVAPPLPPTPPPAPKLSATPQVTPAPGAATAPRAKHPAKHPAPNAPAAPPAPSAPSTLL
jgi:DUF4097 and DUF4098 domain-containing protein YvlB